MPLYEYACDKCGKNFEELVFGDEAVSCPHCGSAQAHRLLSACARRPRGGSADFASAPVGSGGGCGSCMGGNCASCGH